MHIRLCHMRSKPPFARCISYSHNNTIVAENDPTSLSTQRSVFSAFSLTTFGPPSANRRRELGQHAPLTSTKKNQCPPPRKIMERRSSTVMNASWFPP